MALPDQQTDDTKKGSKVPTCDHLSVENLARAEKALLACVQQHHFPEELSALEKGKTSVKKGSRLYKLDPILDDGVLRVGGRLTPLAHCIRPSADDGRLCLTDGGVEFADGARR